MKAAISDNARGVPNQENNTLNISNALFTLQFLSLCERAERVINDVKLSSHIERVPPNAKLTDDEERAKDVRIGTLG
jgi:hypothetical protein